jgi:Domain of unknown function (DUF3597)
MSIFGKIASAIFGGAANAAEVTPAAPAAGSPAAATPAAAAAKAAAPGVTPAATAAKSNVDVAAVLDKLDEDSDESLDWRVSIVDLMKLLKLDSSLKSRKELAKELNYTGDMGDSASMNVWLHKQVMTKLAENGGVVPAELKH